MTTTIPSTDIVASVEPLFTEPERIALAGFLAGRKGGKIVTIPLAPRTARAIDLAIGERLDGPIFLRPDGSGWTGTAPAGSCAGSPSAPASTSPSGRTPCATRSSPPDSMPVFRRPRGPQGGCTGPDRYPASAGATRPRPAAVYGSP